jgi:hypothetical protein
MQFKTVKYIVTAMLGALCCAGCHRASVEAPTPLTVPQTAPALQEAFANADKDLQNEASQCIAAMQKNNWPEAFALLRRLRARTDLTREERAALMRVQQTTVLQLNEAATKGDDNAAAALSDYKVTK